ncbi:MAG: ChbG/HpnK family deacetylase [Coriobacteriales bacterium]|nr:ChbG/HpnK family deacetylase [Coriobacteriales bacterium]
MKLLVQSDDYGITRAVSLGCIHGIQNGVIRNTGMFANMPWIEECVEWIRPYLDKIAFGIDLNASTGPSILGHDCVPVLTHEDGMFLGSRENRALDTDENGHDHLAEAADQLEAEFRAQLERYIELVGKKPDYIHNHAYGTLTTDRITRELAVEYGVMCSVGLNDRPEVKPMGMGWYKWGGPEEQLSEDPLGYITSDKEGILTSGKEYAYLVSHCGYADADLFRLTSFTTCRPMDLDCMVSPELRAWLDANNIELASFKDLPRTWAAEQSTEPKPTILM